MLFDLNSNLTIRDGEGCNTILSRGIRRTISPFNSAYCEFGLKIRRTVSHTRMSLSTNNQRGDNKRKHPPVECFRKIWTRSPLHDDAAMPYSHTALCCMNSTDCGWDKTFTPAPVNERCKLKGTAENIYIQSQNTYRHG